eukprot:jgi/Orpsp1_1/1183533/evm.model.c7180000085632.1
MILVCCYLMFYMVYAYPKITNYKRDTIYKNNILTKSEVLNITDEYNLGFYCRNDTCVQVKNPDIFPFVNFPDENGNLSNYIIESCTYNNAMLGNCRNFTTNLEGILYSTLCSSNSECFSDKCVNSYCVFNDELVSSCDSIYISPSIFTERHSYMHCGRVLNEPCENDDECSSKKCNENRVCELYTDGPYDNEG